MNEKLSALMDGELAREDAQNVIKTLGADESHRQSWDAYHLIGACLRGDEIGASVSEPSSRNSCTDAIFARLAAEPTILAPAAIKKSSFVENRTRLALAVAASMVTVSAVTVVAFRQQQGGTVAPLSLVQQVAPQPIADPALQRAQAELRVNDYLVVHRQFANPNAFQAATLNQAREQSREPSRAPAESAVPAKQAAGH
ncbi:MAG: sigma-E factor negative regulatory protein [Betaproteobacteria bacterium]